MKKIGIMGGTFNPPHIGHIMMAECALEKLGLEKIIFVPTGRIYYKEEGKVSPHDRFSMVLAAISDIPNFEISDIEVKEPNVSYTAETLEKLKEIHNDAKLYFIVGADSFDYMERWKTPEKIFALSTIAVIGRRGFGQEEIQKKADELSKRYGGEICILDMENVDVSSTEIRERCRLLKDITGMVPKGTEEYIKQKNLYSLEK